LCHYEVLKANFVHVINGIIGMNQEKLTLSQWASVYKVVLLSCADLTAAPQAVSTCHIGHTMSQWYMYVTPKHLPREGFPVARLRKRI